VTAVARAYDAAGNMNEDTFTVYVYDPARPNGAPNVRLDLNLITDGIIKGVTEIRGLVDDPDDNLRLYTLEIAPLDTENWQVMFFGNAEVGDGEVLGKFDPTIIEDGVYRVRLAAIDELGLVSMTEGVIDVISGSLKFGEFSLTFADMAVNVGNIPIQLLRTYDTLKLNAPSQDMAPGWRVEFREVDLRTSLGKPNPIFAQSGMYDPNRGFRPGDKVYLTVAGERYAFKVEAFPLIKSGFGVPYMYVPVFTPIGTTKGSLTLSNYGSANLVLTQRADDGMLVNLAGIPFDFTNPFFESKLVLTRDGMQYEIDPVTNKIDRIGKDLYFQFWDRTDRNNNPEEYLELTDSYIRSSYGSQITFERDSRGRIVAAVDPAGNKVLYSYDSEGNLVTVTDRMGHVVRYEYNPGRKHYLERIIDPLNRPTMKFEYDAQGRIVRMIDALGNPLDVDYDPETRMEVATNALGYITTFVFDPDGNCIREIYPDGGTIQRTFDSKGNVLSLTNQLGYTYAYTYDSYGNLTSETDPLGYSSKMIYDQKGNMVAYIDKLGRITATDYQRDGSIKVTFPGGIVAEGKHESYLNMNGVTLFTNVVKNQKGLVASAFDQGVQNNYEYDIHGRKTKEFFLYHYFGGTREIATQYEYDNQGRVTKITYPDGEFELFEYDVAGQVVRQVGRDGVIIENKYDAAGNLIESTDIGKNLKVFVKHDALNRPIVFEADNDTKIYLQYDSMGRIIRQDFAGLFAYQYEYDLAGQLLSESIVTPDQVVKRIEYTYDVAGREIRRKQITSDGSIEILQTLDALGRLVSRQVIIDGTALPVLNYEYDERDQLTKIFPSQNPNVNFVNKVDFDPFKSRTIYDGENNPTKIELGRDGKITAIVDPEGRRSEYTYDELGKVTSYRNANGVLSYVYEYDSEGGLIGVRRADGSRQSIAYDYDDGILSQLVTNYDGTTQVITLLNFRNNTIQITASDGESWLISLDEQNNQSQRLTYSDGSQTASYSFDSKGRLIRYQDLNGKVVQYSYNDLDLVTSITSDDQVVQYTYDDKGRVIRIEDSLNGIFLQSYNQRGQLAERQLPNGFRQKYTYNAKGQLIKLESFDANGQLVFSQEYTRNANSQVTQIRENNGRVINYTYDRSFRLIREEIIDPNEGVRQISYTYDAAGNRLKRVDSHNNVVITTDYTYDNLDRLITESKQELINDNFLWTTTYYTYDANGRLIAQRKTLSSVLLEEKLYTWNVFGQLKGVEIRDGNGQTTYAVEYHYNESGIKIGETENGVRKNFLIDYSTHEPQVLAEYDAAGNLLKAYTYGAQVLSNPLAQYGGGESLYYVTDRLGSTRSVVDTQGNSRANYTYDAYGRIINQSGNADISRLYTGEEYNTTTGLQYLRARYLDPSVGRFISPDEFLGVIGDPITHHSYHYAGLDPVNNTDPSGYSFLAAELKALNARLQLTERGYQVAQKVRTIYEDLASAINLALFTYNVYTASAQAISAVDSYAVYDKIAAYAGDSYENFMDFSGPSTGGGLWENLQVDIGAALDFAAFVKKIPADKLPAKGGKLKFLFPVKEAEIEAGVKVGKYTQSGLKPDGSVYFKAKVKFTEEGSKKSTFIEGSVSWSPFDPWRAPKVEFGGGYTLTLWEFPDANNPLFPLKLEQDLKNLNWGLLIAHVGRFFAKSGKGWEVKDDTSNKENISKDVKGSLAKLELEAKIGVGTSLSTQYWGTSDSIIGTVGDIILGPVENIFIAFDLVAKVNILSLFKTKLGLMLKYTPFKSGKPGQPQLPKPPGPVSYTHLTLPTKA
jgi:RHS repeat-associated protein